MSSPQRFVSRFETTVESGWFRSWRIGRHNLMLDTLSLKRIILPLAAAVLASAGAAPLIHAREADPLSDVRVQVCLNGDWLRRVGGAGEMPPEDGDGWEVVRVPEYVQAAAQGSAWFRLDFLVPPEFGVDGRRVLLRFVRVRHHARVFLNGVRCGENYGARAPFEVDVTDAVRPGEKNRLDVWAHNCDGDYAMPGRSLTDEETIKRLTTFMGYREQATIAEDVFLVSRPELHVSDVLVMPSVRQQSLTVRLTLSNESARERRATLANAVYLGETPAFALPTKEVSLRAGESTTVTISAPWATAQLWGYPPYGEPVLYHLETQVRESANQHTDRLVTRFGFREVWTEGEHIMLNGKKLRLLGYWVPEGSGRSQWTLRMAALRSIGCNTIHNHTEQREPAFYDVADELGMLVWDANYCGGPLGTSATISRDAFPEVLSELKRQYPLWARTVANHPSVVLLMVDCLFNLDAAKQLGEVYRQADATRLLHSGFDITEPLDLACFASSIRMDKEDRLADVRMAYEDWGHKMQAFNGRRVPLVNVEIYYTLPSPDASGAPTNEVIAQPTSEAIDFLGQHDVVGVNIFHQHAFRNEPDVPDAIGWPSRSGESQHATSTAVGGQLTIQDFVNLRDSARPAFEVLPTGRAMQSASSRYLGHSVSVPSVRRPEVLVRVTHAGMPVPDAYVYVVPRQGAPGSPFGLRTDRDGTAWFQLRDPGRYEFICPTDGGSRSVEMDCDLQPLDVRTGGAGPVLQVKLTLDKDN